MINVIATMSEKKMKIEDNILERLNWKGQGEIMFL